MQAAQIAVKKERGVMVVNAMGRTPSGRPYIKASKTLTVTSITDKKFKDEMAAAVKELLDSEA